MIDICGTVHCFTYEYDTHKLKAASCDVNMNFYSED